MYRTFAAHMSSSACIWLLAGIESRFTYMYMNCSSPARQCQLIPTNFAANEKFYARTIMYIEVCVCVIFCDSKMAKNG